MVSISERLRTFLGYEADIDDKVINNDLKRRLSLVCKPCWELKYCPYGPLVEEYPLPPSTRKDKLEHINALKECLSTGKRGNGETLSEDLRDKFERQILEFNPEDYPIECSEFEKEASCSVFGHLCPVFFVCEPFTETEEMRRVGRQIPFSIKIRVARRDNYTCQICGKHLIDSEIEFDHIIPVSKGGNSEEHNLRLTCFDCNREKSNKVKK